ncbi:MAG: polysaccharide deacetylase family protein [Candidatus Cloacimonetes bacterium]|nr:polysaccharide deacetylase family protein [Candidatus Cloacimonadota bacterium]
MLRVALTHDVDRIYKTHQYLSKSIRFLKQGNMSRLIQELASYSKRNEVYWSFPEIMETEAALGLRSTFFFLQESIPFQLFKPSAWKLALGRYDIRSERVASIIRELDRGGWEIGLHGSYLSYADLKLLEQEKGLLEQIVGHPVNGIRQHYLNLSENTWPYQETAGFRYDSSFGFTDSIGYKDGRVKPFNPHNTEFMVFPLAIMDSCYVEDKAREANLKIAIDQTIARNGVLVLNWHSNTWHPDEYKEYKRFYIDLVKRLKDQGAEFNTLNGFYLEQIKERQEPQTEEKSEQI